MSNRSDTLPTFLTIGVPRAGTTWLHEAFEASPEIGVAKFRKEVHFFDEHYERGLDWYAEQFDPAGPSIRTETSPSYFGHADVPARMAEALPDCRFVVVLRDPVERIESQFKRYLQIHGSDRGFRAWLKENDGALQRSLYGASMERWLAFYPLDRFLLVPFTSLTQQTTLESISQFIGASTLDADSTASNASFSPRFAGPYRLLKTVALAARRRNLHAPVQFLKKLGVGRIFEGGAKKADSALSMDDKRHVRALFTEDLLEFERLTGFSTSDWRTR